MKSKLAILGTSNARLRLNFLSQAQGNNPLPADGYFNWSTSNTSYKDLFTAKYSLITQGSLNVTDMFVSVVTNNDANGLSRVFVSGDGGNTFICVINDIPSGVLNSAGVGIWINSIDIGADKLQILVDGKSKDGALTNLRMRLDANMRFVFFKEFT